MLTRALPDVLSRPRMYFPAQEQAEKCDDRLLQRNRGPVRSALSMYAHRRCETLHASATNALTKLAVPLALLLAILVLVERILSLLTSGQDSTLLTLALRSSSNENLREIEVNLKQLYENPVEHPRRPGTSASRGVSASDERLNEIEVLLTRVNVAQEKGEDPLQVELLREKLKLFQLSTAVDTAVLPQFQDALVTPRHGGYLKEHFRAYGYAVVDTDLPHALLDQAVNKLTWEYPNFNKGYRVQDAWKDVEEVKRIALHQSLLDVLASLYGRKPRAFQTLNFAQGTEQPMHQDTIHFQSEPEGWMCAIWVALEDVTVRNGPLAFYKGSNKMKAFTMADFQLQPSADDYPKYEEFLLKQNFDGMPLELGILRKGQALIWDANLVHGGWRRLDKESTRFSQVTHFFFEGTKYYTPMLSHGKKKTYRDPEWVQ